MTKYLDQSLDKPTFEGLPSPFRVADQEKFYAHGLISASEIIVAAKAVLTQQLRHSKTVIKMNCVEQVKDFVALELANAMNERFCALFLDNQLKLIRFETLFYGTVNQAEVYPRELVKRALALNTVNLIIVHNHPSGNALPSEQDKSLTESLKPVLNFLDINLIDHLIVAHDEVFSFSKQGIL